MALVRGDRFYTTDYNVATLTSWGMEYISPNFKDGSKGGLLGKVSNCGSPSYDDPDQQHLLALPAKSSQTFRAQLGLRSLSFPDSSVNAKDAYSAGRCWPILIRKTSR